MTDHRRRSSPRAVRCTLLVAVGCWALVACGGQDSSADASASQQASSSPAGSIDPCALVTSAEAQEVLGAAPTETERPPEANNEHLSTCRYVAPRGQSVVVLVVMAYDRTVGRTAFETAKRQELAMEPVAELGEEAFWIGDLTTLYVLRGDVYFSIGGDASLEQVRPLAQRALGRITG